MISNNFALFALILFILTGCQDAPYLYDVPPPEVEVTQDEDGNDLVINVYFPDEPPEGPSDDDSAGSPELFDCEDRVWWDPHYFSNDGAEVAGFPWITVSSPQEQEVVPGEPVILTYTVTAACGPVHWGGSMFNLDPTSDHGAWNEPFYGFNQAPMPLENLGTGETQTIRSYQVAHVAEGQMFWPGFEGDWYEDSFVGQDLNAWQSVNYRFMFTATEVVPVGATFNLNMVHMVWEDLTTGEVFNLDATPTMHAWHNNPLYPDPVRVAVTMVDGSN